MNEPAVFTVDIRGPKVVITVNGEDISSSVAQVFLDAAGGELPRLGLRLMPDAHIEGVGIVEVLQPETEADTIVRFLENMDARVIGEDILANASLGGPDPIQGTLDWLKDQLRVRT